ncbi:mandelate racemase/muconate lactonizing enzyme family protein, partial [Candidatus Latescibacterota bacterium]
MRIIDAQAFHLKAPLEQHYKTTFGTITHRQAVLIILKNEDGTTGLGETYINFPTWAPFGRMASYREAFFPWTVGRKIIDIQVFMQDLWENFYRASLQGNTLGSTIQAISAVSCALWDIQAKLDNVPLRNLFSTQPAPRVKIYGSGINPPFPVDALKKGLDMGIDVFKLKLGFGDEADRKNIQNLKKILGAGVRIAVDVNRSWSFDRTITWMDFLEDNEIVWLEEPLDLLNQHRYAELFERTAVPISAGENFLIPPGTDFKRENEWGLTFNETNLALNIVQPAVVKNCCFSDAVRLLHHVEKAGKKLYPHFLGSAPGMAASAQLASLSNDPHLEWDINPNP